MISRQLPSYFSVVRDRARQRWDQLEKDPELAAPWKQLFSQVQSPRHVLSELLQNADDAGASRVRACFQEDQFIFEHDGKDFDPEEFASLCRFGFSNKRNLRTIGFRGVGFKSTFSLGDTVEVLTPSLAVRFHKHRFTEPVWIDEAPPCELTRISIRVQDPNRQKELRKNLQEWTKSPASLLFFSSVQELTIDNVTLRKMPLGPGPVSGSQKIRLVGQSQCEVLLFISPEEPLPEEALDEIRQERNVEDLWLPPCSVELVLGLPGDQRLYTVLPTGVILDTPFSCNAPFIPDPGRSGIKAPSLSPTNRWLLQRLGRFASSNMLEWLRNESLGLEERAQAYSVFPKKPQEDDSLKGDATSAICTALLEVVGAEPLLLTAEGRLAHSTSCFSVPKKMYAVWDPAQIAEVFEEKDKDVLCEAVGEDHRSRLQSWGVLKHMGEDELIVHLETNPRIPRPPNEKLLVLWSVVQDTLRHDYGGSRRRRLRLVPVEGSDVLLSPEYVVRLPSKKQSISDEAWAFLSALVRVVDPGWLAYLGSAKELPGSDANAALQLLEDIGLGRPTPTDAIVASASAALFARNEVLLEEHVRLAHLLAALDAKTPEEFRVITRDGQQHRLEDGLVVPQDYQAEELLPEAWVSAHLLHEAYFIFSDSSACTRQRWEEWVRSDKSGFAPFAPIRKKRQHIWGRSDLVAELRRRGATERFAYFYSSENFRIDDYDFDDELVKHWEAIAQADTTVWMKVTTCILRAPGSYWEPRIEARLFQISNKWSEKEVAKVPPAWLVRLRGKACLPDTWGKPHVPAELYLRTPATEPLLDVEPFVDADLDVEATKPLLRALGVRATPAGVGSLLERIRALARGPEPSRCLAEIVKWYGALDKAMVRCDESAVAIREVFADEALILTKGFEWARASEVFQYASPDECPDVPVVHEAVNTLGMWTRLGVAQRPTLERVVEWLKKLPSGEQLDPGIQRRVRAVLARYPEEVWRECQHWLTLDGAWAPVQRLRFRLIDGKLKARLKLFAHVEAETADLGMLSDHVCNRQPFAGLPGLESSIEYRLAAEPDFAGDPEQKEWIQALAGALIRIQLDNETETWRVRQAAEKLAQSVWQRVRFGSLRVVPYVDGQPAGEEDAPEVLWYEDKIFVSDGSLPRLFEALVRELERPFANDQITAALRACIERDPAFVRDYVQVRFNLEPERTPPDGAPGETEGSETTAWGAVTGPEGGAGAAPEDETQALVPVDESQEEQDTDEDGRGSPRQRNQEPSLFSLFKEFAIRRGFRWDEGRKRFFHEDGRLILRSQPPFHWQCFDGKGNLVTRHWVAKGLLRQGVQIPAEVWELFRRWPEECSLVIVNEQRHPTELRGVDLVGMVEKKQLSLYPATYRLRALSSF